MRDNYFVQIFINIPDHIYDIIIVFVIYAYYSFPERVIVYSECIFANVSTLIPSMLSVIWSWTHSWLSHRSTSIYDFDGDISRIWEHEKAIFDVLFHFLIYCRIYLSSIFNHFLFSIEKIMTVIFQNLLSFFNMTISSNSRHIQFSYSASDMKD